MFIPMKSMMSTRPKFDLTCGGVDKHSSWKVCYVLVMIVVTVWQMWSCSVAVISSKKTCVENLG